MISSAWKHLSGSLKSMTIKGKLLLSYFIMIFLSLGLLATISYFTVSSDLESKIQHSTSQSFDQAYTFLSYIVNTMIDSSDVVYFNNDVQTVLTRNKEAYEYDLVQQNIDMLKLDQFLDSFKNSEEIYRVGLYLPGWVAYSNQGVNFLNLDTFLNTSDYKNLALSSEKVLWLPPEKIKNDTYSLDPISVISLLRKVRNSNQINEYIGVIKVSILESGIKSILDKANTTETGVVYLQNTNGAIISASSKENIQAMGLDEDIKKDMGEKTRSWELMTIGSKRYEVTSKPVGNTDWTMISAIPYSEILSQSNKIRDFLFPIMLVIGIIAYFLAYIFSTSSVERINVLMRTMKKVQEGQLDVRIVSKSQDEIGKLIESFNYMVKKINILVEEQYQTGKEIKNAELKALQAQINPHFLYNTLDLINWKAIDNNVPDIALIARSLATFYKLSLNKGKEVVSIKDELDHIKYYVQIQNMRFDNRINLILDIDESLYHYEILKIILQPIVENSILHGILENRDQKDGVIKISGALDDHTIVFSVEDNGVGISKEKASAILSGESTDDAQGYGVYNIINRIKLFYGQQYGLAYHCAPGGQGTLVEIRIPAVKAGETA
jgi:two-component system, sensor histidine kinase YesM